MQQQISLLDIWHSLKKNMLTIIIGTFVGIGIAGFYTFFIVTPKYSSHTELLPAQVSVKNDENSLDNVNRNLQMISTYKSFINSDFILDETINLLSNNEKISVSQLKSMIDVRQETDSQMFSIKIITDNPQRAVIIANTITEVFVDKIPSVIDDAKITIVSNAKINFTPESPNKKINLAAGAFLGMSVSLLISVAFSYFDNKFSSKEEIREQYNYLILGEVSFQDLKHQKKLINDTKKALNNFYFESKKRKRKE